MARSGHLSVKPLPAHLQAPIWLDAVDLHRDIEDALGCAVDLTLTDNRRSMIRLRPNDDGSLRLRLHHMFVHADDDVVDALATLADTRAREIATKIARSRLRAFTRAHSDKVKKKKPKRRVRLKTQGRTHDLVDLKDAVLEEDFSQQEAAALDAVRVTWGRWGKPGQPIKSIRLGSYDPRRTLVRVHPILDRPNVPAWVVRFILFHELLHHVIPAKRRRGRVVHHGPAFREREMSHPRYEDYELWTAEVLITMMAEG